MRRSISLFFWPGKVRSSWLLQELSDVLLSKDVLLSTCAQWLAPASQLVYIGVSDQSEAGLGLGIQAISVSNQRGGGGWKERMPGMRGMLISKIRCFRVFTQANFLLQLGLGITTVP